MFTSREPGQFPRDPEPWVVTLTAVRRYNGKWRVWRGTAQDWDDACERAEAANPGWTTHTAGHVLRPKFNTPVNRILVEFRYSVRLGASLASMVQVFLNGHGGVDATPAEIEHARKVLTRLAALTEGSDK